MKFKGIIIGILAAILAANIVTSYMLMKEAKKTDTIPRSTI